MKKEMEKGDRVMVIGGDCCGYPPTSEGTVVRNTKFQSSGQPAVKVKMDRDGAMVYFVPHIEVELI